LMEPFTGRVREMTFLQHCWSKTGSRSSVRASMVPMRGKTGIPLATVFKVNPKYIKYASRK
jgi:hypothetical protein